MTDYERWLENMIEKTKADEEYEQVCKQCDHEIAIAKIMGENVNQTITEAENRKLKAELNREFVNR